ncbi:MAG: hypothetical protein HY067_10410 [Betaproteobacteria bacterium]|nr:hypothetical protein [Betaproteobacteria bacterium]
MAPKPVGDIRVSALNVRLHLEIAESRIDMVKLLENGLRRNGIHYHIVESSRIPGEAARAIPDKGEILLAAETYEAICEGDPSYQLIVPHELGHIVLRHAATFARATSNASHTSIEDSETQADRFSHEFTMPVLLVQRHCKSIRAIQDVFNVTRLEASIRKDTLYREGLIDW